MTISTLKIHADMEPVPNERKDQVSPCSIKGLPGNLPVDSLNLAQLQLQLRPEQGFQGLPQMPLTHLHLEGCLILDGPAGLSTALPLLTQPQHLALRSLFEDDDDWAFSDSDAKFSIDSQYRSGSIDSQCSSKPRMHVVPLYSPAEALEHLQSLTHLETSDSDVSDSDTESDMSFQEADLSRLQRLTALQHLQLGVGVTKVSTAATAGMQQLTFLKLSGGWGTYIEPAALADKPQLHLSPDGPEGVAMLLSQLQQLTQLTSLFLGRCEMSAEPTRFSALTASSGLQVLDLIEAKFPAGVWQHVFLAGRQLPNLTSLQVRWKHSDFEPASKWPELARLTGFCPSLQHLSLGNQWNRLCTLGRSTRAADATSVLAQLAGLSSLTSLDMQLKEASGAVILAQLTGLKSLFLEVWVAPHPFMSGWQGMCKPLVAVLLLLAALTGLTSISVWSNYGACFETTQADQGGDPCWRQLLEYCIQHGTPEEVQIAQQAAAGVTSPPLPPAVLAPPQPAAAAASASCWPTRATAEPI